jgi:hypothetical protein
MNTNGSMQDQDSLTVQATHATFIQVAQEIVVL